MSFNIGSHSKIHYCKGLRLILVMVGANMLCAGCDTMDSLPFPSSGGQYVRRVQGLVDDKIRTQSQDKTGQQRWKDFESDQYQTEADIVNGKTLSGREQKREKAAKVFVQSGPVDVTKCMAYALEFNDQVQAARESIRSTYGDQLINRSRFLPQVDYNVCKQTLQNSSNAWTQDTNEFFGYRQTLIEFGKDSPSNVTLRDVERKALFGYEETVAKTLSDIRLKFYTIILRQQQLAERKVFLQQFQDRFKNVQALEKARRVLEVDVLTSRLNVLNEEARMNSLEKEILRQKIDLMHLIGISPDIANDAVIQGQLEDFAMDLPKAVGIALKRSTQIAEARAKAAEQARVTSDVKWSYMPDLSLDTGWTDGRSAVGLGVEANDGYQRMSSFSRQATYSRSGNLGPLPTSDDGLYDTGGLFMGLSMSMPIFDGLERQGRQIRENAFLRRAYHQLRDIIEQTDASVRKVYQTVLERRKELSIRQETVTISMERLRIQERLKDLGKISDDQLETFRDRYFEDQDAFFEQQISMVEAQERVRLEMRYFELLPLETATMPSSQPTTRNADVLSPDAILEGARWDLPDYKPKSWAASQAATQPADEDLSDR